LAPDQSRTISQASEDRRPQHLVESEIDDLIEKLIAKRDCKEAANG
jgi:hypothetical protein